MTIDIAKLRELEKSATPGPWQVGEENESRAEIFARRVIATVHRDRFGAPRPDDASLIVAARNALPALLDELEAARADLETAMDLGHKLCFGSVVDQGENENAWIRFEQARAALGGEASKCHRWCNGRLEDMGRERDQLRIERDTLQAILADSDGERAKRGEELEKWKECARRLAVQESIQHGPGSFYEGRECHPGCPSWQALAVFDALEREGK